MGYIISLRTMVNKWRRHNIINKIPCDTAVSLDMMYEHCKCDIVDIRTVPLFLNTEDPILGLTPKVALIFDDDFLLKNPKPVANEIASLVFGYGFLHNNCLCGDVLMCLMDSEGDCQPFSEHSINNIISTLNDINNITDDIQFVVQKPKHTFITF